MRNWLLSGLNQPESTGSKRSWWQVMCLTGVDYFSTLGYQPGIAALPVYRSVAKESPYGLGSLSMLEGLLPGWRGKLLVLSMLGFVATAFIVTITLSAADATAHLLHNPFVPEFMSGWQVPVTLLLIAGLGAVFLVGFSEAISIAVVLVAVYLVLNVVVMATAVQQVLSQPRLVINWENALGRLHEPGRHDRRLAVRHAQARTRPVRVRDGRGGDAAGQGRARRAGQGGAQAADDRRDPHERLPDHLQFRHHDPDPRRGVRGGRPGQITVAFGADVESQGGAYATGVLALILSAAIAVTLSAWKRRSRAAFGFGIVTLIFGYATVANILERPDGLVIALLFVLAILVVSFCSRARRSTELRATSVSLDELALRYINEAAEIHLIAHAPLSVRDHAEYVGKCREVWERHRVRVGEGVLFLEVTVSDASEFETELRVVGEERYGFRVLRVEGPTVPNAIAATLLHLRGEVLRQAEPDADRRPLVHVG